MRHSWLRTGRSFISQYCTIVPGALVHTLLFANSFPFFTSSFGLIPLRNLASVTTLLLPACNWQQSHENVTRMHSGAAHSIYSPQLLD